MSWENIVKSTFKRDIYKAYKEAIKNYYESNDLGNFTLDELHSQSKDYALTYLRRHPNINPRAASAWLNSNKPKRILPNILTALEKEGVIQRINAKGRGGIFKSWDSTLKTGQSRSAARKLVEKTIKEMVEKFLEGKDKVNTDELRRYIIDNLKAEHIKRHTVDGKVTSVISGQPTRYIKNKLDTSFPNKILPMAKTFGYDLVYARRGDPSYLIKKSDSWESMVDSMVDEKTFEPIYTAILRKFKFSSPSKEKVVSYLNANYERHPLFSNKWSTKSEGDGQ